MSCSQSSVTAEFSRGKALGLAAVAAVLVHGAALFGMRTVFDLPVASAPERGITIDLAPSSIQPPIRAPKQPSEKTEISDADPPPSEEEQATVAPPPEITRTAEVKKQPGQHIKPVARAGAAATAAAAAGSSALAAPESESGPESGPEVLTPYANEKPTYPELARRRGQEGLVQLLAHVDDRGTLTELAVKKSSGYSLLDEAAMKAVRKWRFRPGISNGRPVRGILLIPVEFRLKK
ncbi:MAG: energy transducer TonB [Desulfovibrio sp.]|nr:energy transducer TonB [Desulfovibrio sp.]